MVAKNVDFKWYKYTDNAGHDWAAKVSKNVGENAAFGFDALDDTKPIITMRGRTRMRSIVWVDSATGRMTRTPVGSADATIIDTHGAGFTSYGRDTTTDIVYSFYAFYQERISRGHVIANKAQPA